MPAISANENKVTSWNAFIENNFALSSGKESKIDERTHFWNFSRILDVAVKG